MAKCHIYVGNICERIRIIKLDGHTKALMDRCFVRPALFMQLQAEVKLSAFSLVQNNISFLAQLCSCNDLIRFMTLKIFLYCCQHHQVIPMFCVIFFFHSVLFIFLDQWLESSHKMLYSKHVQCGMSPAGHHYLEDAIS